MLPFLFSYKVENNYKKAYYFTKKNATYSTYSFEKIYKQYFYRYFFLITGNITATNTNTALTNFNQFGDIPKISEKLIIA